MLRLFTMACLVALAGCSEEAAYDPDRQENNGAADIGDQLGAQNEVMIVNETPEDLGEALNAANAID